VRDARVLAANTETYPRAKAESRKQQRHAWKLRPQKIERGPNIALLAVAAVVFALAQACAAKIKPQHGNAEGIDRFRRLINHFVVHRSAKERMRMADDRCQ